MNDASTTPRDVRMRGFARRTTVADALVRLDRELYQLPAETATIIDAADRVLASHVQSQIDVPGFVL